jgi:hypothetical protein
VIIDLEPLHLIDRTKNENNMIDDIISLPASSGVAYCGTHFGIFSVKLITFE